MPKAEGQRKTMLKLVRHRKRKKHCLGKKRVDFLREFSVDVELTNVLERGMSSVKI